MKYEECADAADGIGHDQAQGKSRRPLGDEAHAIANRVHGMPVQIIADAPCSAPEQRIDAKAETHKGGEQGQDAPRPPASEAFLEYVGRTRELRRHARQHFDHVG